MLNMALSVTGAVTRRSRPVLIGFTKPPLALDDQSRLKLCRTYCAPSEWPR